MFAHTALCLILEIRLKCKLKELICSLPISFFTKELWSKYFFKGGLFLKNRSPVDQWGRRLAIHIPRADLKVIPSYSFSSVWAW